jgi:lipopolysaccharide export system permease protein
MALFKLPRMLNTIMPFAIMIGGMVAFWRLARSHELTVARAVGISVWQFLSPVALLVFLIGIINITILDPIAATLYGRYEAIETELGMKDNNPLSIGAGGLWLRENNKSGGQAILHATDVRQNQGELILHKVDIYNFSRDGFESHFEADTGKLANNAFIFENVTEMQVGFAGKKVATYEIPTALSLNRIQDNFASPERVSFWDLPRFIDFFDETGFSSHRHRLHYQALLASPLLLSAMLILAAAFSMTPNQRGGGIFMRILFGVGAGFFLFFFSKVTYALGLSATIPIALSAWSPSVIALLLGVSILLHLEDG